MWKQYQQDENHRVPNVLSFYPELIAICRIEQLLLPSRIAAFDCMQNSFNSMLAQKNRQNILFFFLKKISNQWLRKDVVIEKKNSKKILAILDSYQLQKFHKKQVLQVKTFKYKLNYFKLSINRICDNWVFLNFFFRVDVRF